MEAGCACPGWVSVHGAGTPWARGAPIPSPGETGGGCGECSGRNTCFAVLNFSGKKNWIVLYPYTDIYICTETEFELIKTMQYALTTVYNAVKVLYLGASTGSGKRTCVPLATPISFNTLYGGVITKLSYIFHLLQESGER